jgi:hypothetical protein
MPTNRDELRAITMPVGKIATFHPTILPATSDSAENVLLTGRERSFVDCLFFLDYSGGVEELDKSLAMFPSFDFEAALAYLKLLRSPWLYSRLGFLLDRLETNSFFVERPVTVFSTNFRAVWSTSRTNVPANAGSLRGNSWCLRRSHLHGRVPCKHEIHTRTNPHSPRTHASPLKILRRFSASGMLHPIITSSSLVARFLTTGA